MKTRNEISAMFGTLIVLPLLLQCSYGKDFPSLNVLRSKTPASDQAAAVKLLVQRFVGGRAAEFDVSVVQDESSFLDSYQVTSDGTTISIRGTTGVAAARGFNYVLTDLFGGLVSWSGNRIHLPEPGHFPVIRPGEVNVTGPQRFRYYQNVCAASYSFVWWDWARWQQEIDWMALNGYSLPLAFNGQEAVWQKVYLKMGLTQADLDKYFGGPAFLAWARMGNLKAWGGPLPQSWLDNDLALQKQILQRMRSFGMIPVLPGFAGHVPGGFSRVFPQAQVSQLPTWSHHFDCNLSCTYLLDPVDPLFKVVGSSFLQTQEEEYGYLDHIYNADTFNELTPKSSDPEYLANISRGIYEGMAAYDPKAVWLMQGWLFRYPFWGPKQTKALLTAVPEGNLMVLDLAADTTAIYNVTESFYGQPFIWCMLQNFGGNHGLYGRVDAVNTAPFQAMAYEGSTMVGVGATPEGIEQNDFIYAFFNSLTFRDKTLNVTDWVRNYSRNRYGVSDNNIDSAWQLLASTIYNCQDNHTNHNHGVPVERPRLTLAPPIWYNWKDIGKAWKSMLAAADKCNTSDLCRYDLVDITRQVLQDLSYQVYQNVTAAYDLRSERGVLMYGQSLLEIISDMDRITSSHSKWLLGNWLESAKRMGKNDDEKKLYEYNARNQITLWGPDGQILDYANKQWGGLLKSYYHTRWALFVKYLTTVLAEHTTYHSEVFKNMSFRAESAWTFSRELYPVTPQGDTVSISMELYSKYRDIIEQPGEEWRKPISQQVQPTEEHFYWSGGSYGNN